VVVRVSTELPGKGLTCRADYLESYPVEDSACPLLDRFLHSPAAHAVRRDELWRNQAHGVAVDLELPCPVVAPEHAWMAIVHDGSAAASAPSLARVTSGCFRPMPPDLGHAVQCKHVLGEIDSNADNAHGYPFLVQWMKVPTSHRGALLPISASKMAGDGQVPFIR